MTRVLVWKEMREQWTSAVAVLLLGAILFISVGSLTDYSASRFEVASALLFVMAWVCGLVAGVQPLAAEFEAGTLNWLDALPVSRRQIWRSKALAAAGVVAVETLLLWILMLALGGHDPQSNPLTSVGVAILFALCGYSGGLFGSTVARSSMGAFAWGIVTQFVMGWIFALFVGTLSVGSGPRPFLSNTGFALFVISVCAVPLVISARRFSRLDRLRKTAGPASMHPVSEWRAIAWLTWRQSRGVAYAVLGIGFLAAMIVPQVAPHLWPAVGMLLGVAAGVGTFGADQAGGVHRFLGERRADPGRLWLVKQAVRFAPLAIVIVIYFLIGLARYLSIYLDVSAVARPAGQENLEQLLRHYNLNLVLLGPVFGYALGQFFGLITSKEAIGAVLALFAAVGVGFVWTPSLTIGGVHFWQWVVPPIVLIVATRPAIWNWLTGRLATWQPIIGLAAALLFTAAGVAGGIYFRVIEPPMRGDPFDVAAFEQSLPKPEENQAGQAIGLAIRELQTHLKKVDADFHQGESWRGGDAPLLMTKCQDAIADAKWPAGDEQLDRWLDTICADKWLSEIRAAVPLPLGKVNLGGDSNSNMDWKLETTAQTAVNFLEARALRSTSRGDVEAALNDLDLALGLTRQLLCNGNSWRYYYASRGEESVAALLPAWGVKAVGRSDLLRRAGDMLRSHLDHRPPFAHMVKFEYVLARDSIPAVPQDAKSDLYRDSLHTPWEEVRTREILATYYAGLLRTTELSYGEVLRRVMAASPPTVNPDWWYLADWIAPTTDPAEARRAGRQLLALLHSSVWWNSSMAVGLHNFANNAHALVTMRAAQYQLALIAYEAKTGHGAENLQSLVPDYLPALPADPFADGPFRYRVSNGEHIHWKRLGDDDKAYRDVAVGQGVLWSVGPDLNDDGGINNDGATWPNSNQPPHCDIIFLVPVVKPK